MNFNKSIIQNNFSQAAGRYNKNAFLQKIAAKKLTALAFKDIASANKILDLGCGTGFIAQNISQNFIDKEIYQLDFSYQMLKQNPFQTPKINADIEFLPFKANVFDLVISSLSFQWLNNLPQAIKNISKIIKKSGYFYFNIIGRDSLKELKESSWQCGVDLSINDFIDKKDLEKILQKNNLKFEIKIEEINLYYDDLYNLLKSIKSIGAGYSKNKKFIKRNQFDEVNDFYLKNFNLNNKVFATWQILQVRFCNTKSHP